MTSVLSPYVILGFFFCEVTVSLAISKSCLVNNLPLGNDCLKRILHVRLACYAPDTLRKAEKSSQSQVERLKEREIKNSRLWQQTTFRTA